MSLSDPLTLIIVSHHPTTPCFFLDLEDFFLAPADSFVLCFSVSLDILVGFSFCTAAFSSLSYLQISHEYPAPRFPSLRSFSPCFLSAVRDPGPYMRLITFFFCSVFEEPSARPLLFSPLRFCLFNRVILLDLVWHPDCTTTPKSSQTAHECFFPALNIHSNFRPTPYTETLEFHFKTPQIFLLRSPKEVCLSNFNRT